MEAQEHLYRERDLDIFALSVRSEASAEQTMLHECILVRQGNESTALVNIADTLHNSKNVNKT